MDGRRRHVALSPFRLVRCAPALAPRLVNRAGRTWQVDRAASLSGRLIHGTASRPSWLIYGAATLARRLIDGATTLSPRLVNRAATVLWLVERTPSLAVRLVDGASPPFRLIDRASSHASGLIDGAPPRTSRFVDRATHFIPPSSPNRVGTTQPKYIAARDSFGSAYVPRRSMSIGFKTQQTTSLHVSVRFAALAALASIGGGSSRRRPH
jgi:hypothetical protein